MNLGTLYQDAMDSTRTVRPVRSDGLSEIYFDGIFVGKAPVPPHLFDAGNTAIGFYPWTPPEEPLEDMGFDDFDDDDDYEYL